MTSDAPTNGSRPTADLAADTQPWTEATVRAADVVVSTNCGATA